MSVWPATLPQKPLQSGWKETFADTGIRTKMEVGPAKTRRRTTAGVKPHEAAFYMTWEEVETLETFYNTTLASGTLEFQWEHPRTGETEDWRFTGPPEIMSWGTGFQVTFGLEQMP
jgi:hypothetical protein